MLNKILKKLKKRKGQAALEYLLIIGGVLIVAVIVISLIMSLSRSNRESAASAEEQHRNQMDSSIIPPVIVDVQCVSAESSLAISILYNEPSSDHREYCIVFDGDILADNCEAHVAGSNTISFNVLASDVGFATFTEGVRHKVSLITKAGGYVSSPAVPAPTCIVK